MVRLIQQPTAGVDLLEQYRQSGSPDIFALIMRAYGGMVLSVCYKVTKDAADAEDASQAVFLTLAVQCKTGSPIQYLGPWLKKVAKRTALDLVRSKKRRTRRETVTAENRPEHYNVRPGARPEADELNAIIRAELDELPGKYKMPLVLHYFGGLSHDQISKEMKCTTAALGVRLHRARKMLGKRLSARGISLEGAALGVALAAAVPAVFTDRFIHSTNAAVLGLHAATFAQPVMMSGPLPDNFAAVLSLVHQVGHSMAKARLKMAAVTLAASITMLGGAAEAVRILPDSIRPNLDFLAPSQLLKNLLTPAIQPMHLQAPTKPAVQVAMANVPAAAPTYYTGPSTSSLFSTSTNQPILALQIPVQVPPPSNAQPVALTSLATPSTGTGHALAYTTLATTASAAPVVSRMSVRDDSFHITSSSGGGGDGVAPAAETPSNSISSAGPGFARPGPMISGFPSPDRFGPPPTANLSATHAVGGFEAVAVGGATHDHIPPASSINPSAPPIGPLALATGANAFVPDSIILHNNSVFVPGDGSYHWADETSGIVEGGVNSVDFTLGGVSFGGGVVSIERLPITTTLAPVRPTGHHFIGIWSMSSTADYQSIRLTAHYDSALAQSLSLREDVLKLWVYDNGAWTRIMDSTFSRDLLNHTLSGDYSAAPQFFAVSAPEPASLAFFGIASVLLLRRRRSKTV